MKPTSELKFVSPKKRGWSIKLTEECTKMKVADAFTHSS